MNLKALSNLIAIFSFVSILLVAYPTYMYLSTTDADISLRYYLSQFSALALYLTIGLFFIKFSTKIK